MRIPSKLLAVIRKEDKERFASSYKEHNYVLEVIREVLEKEIEDLEISEECEDNFSSPNWDKHMAYLLGRRKQLRIVLNLFPKLKENQ